MKQIYFPQISKDLFGSYWTKVIMQLHDGSFLFSTFGGLYRISGKKGNESVEAFSELNDKPFKSFDLIFEDAEHNIYVKDIAESLYMLSESASGKYALKKTFYLTSDVLKMTEDRQQVYLATSTGLFVLNKKTLILEKSSINSRLPFTSVSDILVENNKTWVFGEKGLYFYNAAQNSGRLSSQPGPYQKEKSHDKDDIPFNVQQAGNDIYLIIPAANLSPGEYGFLNMMLIHGGGMKMTYTVFAFGIN